MWLVIARHANGANVDDEIVAFVQTLIASLSRVSKVLPTHGVMRARASTLVSLKESLRAPAAASCIAKDHTGS
jgi:hypothetical protein